MPSWFTNGLLYIALMIGLLFGTLAVFSPLTILNGAAILGGGSQNSFAIPYGPLSRQFLDIYAPINAKHAPVVVFFYGGSWNSGKREDYRYVGDALASRGIVAVIADYQLYPAVTYPVFLQDAATAVAWTLQHIETYGGDAARVYVAGHSAGAYIAAMLALDKRWLQAAGVNNKVLAGWIGLAGPYNFLPIIDPEIKPIFHFPATPPDSQPINHVQADAPAALLLTARDDSIVDPHRNTLELAKALQHSGASVHLIQYSRLSHKLLIGALGRPLRWYAPVLDAITDFVAQPQQSKIGD